MNSVQLVGRLTRNPEIRVANAGSSIARFGLAVGRRFKQEGQPDADFISCVAFGKTAEFIEKYFHKGNAIGVQGRIQTGSYEKDGTKFYTTDVVIENCEFVESKGNSQQSSVPAHSDNQDFMNIPDDIDEELPFN